MNAIVRIEIALLWRDPRVRWCAGLLALLLTLSFAAALHDAATAGRDRQRMAAAERARWIAQPDKSPHSAAHYGVWAVKSASPLRVLDPGVEPFVGTVLKLEAHRRYEAVYRPHQDADPIQRTGSGHVAGLLLTVAPLAVILLGFSAFAIDRERGTLRLALGNGASPARLLAGRFTALFLVATVAIVGPALGLGLVAGIVLPGDGWQVGWRLPLWTGVWLGYAAIFLATAMAVSLRAKTARGALTVLLILWALLCVAAPRMASAWVDARAPLPSYAATRARIEAETKAYDSAENWAARRRATLRAYHATSEDAVPIDLRGAQLIDSERHGWRLYDRLLGGFYDRVQRQDDLYGWTAFASPAIGAGAVSEAIAGTDFRQHRAYLDGAEGYRRMLVTRLNEALRDHKVAKATPYVAGKALWADIPGFDWRPMPLAETLPALVPPLAALALWLAAAGLAAMLAVRRITA